jgi:hypothetical protein
MTTRVGGMALAACIGSAGCNVLGPSCLDQQKTGTVANISDKVAAGAVRSHLVPYDRNGSQNDVRFSWPGQGTVSGPKLSIYATRANCQDENFRPPTSTPDPVPNQGDCTLMERPGGYLGPDGQIVPTSLIIGGPGNGNPADFHEYKLFVVGDPAQTTSYSIAITWFSGPDC